MAARFNVFMAWANDEHDKKLKKAKHNKVLADNLANLL